MKKVCIQNVYTLLCTVSVCVWHQGWAAQSRVLQELKCWQCQFIQPCDMIYVRDTECKCPACDQQTKQQRETDYDQNDYIVSFTATMLSLFLFLSLFLSLVYFSAFFTPCYPSCPCPGFLHSQHQETWLDASGHVKLQSQVFTALPHVWNFVLLSKMCYRCVKRVKIAPVNL